MRAVVEHFPAVPLLLGSTHRLALVRDWLAHRIAATDVQCWSAQQSSLHSKEALWWRRVPAGRAAKRLRER